MRTRKSTVTFRKPFTLNGAVGELPSGTYEIETDEEEFLVGGRTGSRRSAIILYVQSGGSTRSLAAKPSELDAALERDVDGG